MFQVLKKKNQGGSKIVSRENQDTQHLFYGGFFIDESASL